MITLLNFCCNFIIFVASLHFKSFKSSINDNMVCITSNEYFLAFELEEEDKYAKIKIENLNKKDLIVLCEGDSSLFTKYPLLDLSLQCHLNKIKQNNREDDDEDKEKRDHKEINYQMSDEGIISPSSSSSSSSVIRHELFLTSKSLIKKDKYDIITSPKSEDIKKGEYIDWICYDGNILTAIPRSMVHTYNMLHRGIGAMILDWNGCIFIHKRASSKRLFPSMLDMLMGGVSSTNEPSEETLLRELREELNLDFQDIQDNSNINFISTKYNNKKRIKNKDSLLQSLSSQEDITAYKQFKTSVLDAVYGRQLRPTIDFNNKIEEKEEEQDVIMSKSSMIRFLGRTRIFTSYNHCLVDVYGVVCSEKKAKNISFADGEVEWGRWVTSKELQDLLSNERACFVPDGLQVWDAIPNMMM